MTRFECEHWQTQKHTVVLAQKLAELHFPCPFQCNCTVHNPCVTIMQESQRIVSRKVMSQRRKGLISSGENTGIQSDFSRNNSRLNREDFVGSAQKMDQNLRICRKKKILLHLPCKNKDYIKCQKVGTTGPSFIDFQRFSAKRTDGAQSTQSSAHK